MKVRMPSPMKVWMTQFLSPKGSKSTTMRIYGMYHQMYTSFFLSIKEVKIFWAAYSAVRVGIML